MTAADNTAPVVQTRRKRPLLAVVGMTVVGFWLLMAVIGPYVAPYTAAKRVDLDFFGPMSLAFPLGTDYLGRDMLSLVLYGARYTIGLALAATVLACIAGTSLGLLAAAVGGWLDAILSRALDALVSIPSLLFSLVVITIFKSSIPILIAAAAVIYTPGAYRIARSLAVNVNATDFVTVARARGESTRYVMFTEILPNITGPILADFGLRFVFVILLLSRLSFLGLGVQPPLADWGSLVRQNLAGFVYGAPAVIAPAVAIASLTISVNMIIDSLQLRRPSAMEGQ
ncbi:MAG TPA: ABC transporter permease [Hyphomicrobiaceae bacterium]|nr:ABC transporter permease [Hyphomicrobiaceae bacterium]